MKIAISVAIAGLLIAFGFLANDIHSIEEDTTVCYWSNAGTENEPNWVFISDYTEDGLCHYGMD